MSESYSGSLKSIEIRPFVEIISPEINLRSKQAGRFTLGSITNGLSPVRQLSSDSLLAVNHLLAMHDAYLSAACDYSNYYESTIPSQRYLMSSIAITTDKGNNGRCSKTDVPLLVSPVSIAKVVTDKKIEHIRAGILGLYCRHGLIVTHDGDASSFVATLRHEVGHAVLDSLPWLKQEMYGDDDSTRTEEICMHVVMDHFDKFISLGDLTINSHVALGGPIDKRTKDDYWADCVKEVSVSHTVFDSVMYKGKSFIKHSLHLKPDDDTIYHDVREVFSYYSKYSGDPNKISVVNPLSTPFCKKGL
jgi:hypothetical protein